MYRSRFAFVLAMAALAAILVPSSLTAHITFQRTYGGAGGDHGYSVQQTTDGGYIIAGGTDSYSTGLDDVYLVRTDSNGDTLWTRTYGDTLFNHGYSVQQTTDGGYIIAGTTGSDSGTLFDFYLIKTNANGDTLWARTYGSAGDDNGRSVWQTTNGGYAIAGYVWVGTYHVIFIRTDANGREQLWRMYGGTGDNQGYSVQQTSDGGFIIAGTTTSSGAGGWDLYLLRTDASGDTLWTRAYGGADDEVGYSVEQTTDGGFIVAGYTGSFGTQSNMYVVKTNASGDTLWTRVFSGSAVARGNSVRQTADHGYIISGAIWLHGTPDAYLVKTDSLGDTMWTKALGGASWDEGLSVKQTTDKGYIIAGNTMSFGSNGPDVYLIKTDSLGRTAVEEPETNPTRAPALSLSCEPNPCRGQTAISLQLTANSPAGLAIFDASGRRVRTLDVNRTPYTVWDGTDELGHALPSGTYFLRLAVGGQQATTRIVLQR
jgi:hypothetical protein